MWATEFSICLFLTQQPQWARASSFTRFLDHTQRRTTVGRTPLDVWSARRTDLYLTKHNNHNIQTSMSPVGFEPAIPAGCRSQTHALYRVAVGTGVGDWSAFIKTVHSRNVSTVHTNWTVIQCKAASIFTQQLFTIWKVSTFFCVMQFLMLRNNVSFSFISKKVTKFVTQICFRKKNLGHEIKAFPQHNTNVCRGSSHVAS
jgi:hypothetical protein